MRVVSTLELFQQSFLAGIGHHMETDIAGHEGMGRVVAGMYSTSSKVIGTTPMAG
jgi:hypothetical protein